MKAPKNMETKTCKIMFLIVMIKFIISEIILRFIEELVKYKYFYYYILMNKCINYVVLRVFDNP